MERQRVEGKDRTSRRTVWCRQPREALEVLQEVTSAAPGMMRAQTLSARCWLSLGHRDKALEHLGIAATTAERRQIRQRSLPT
jgi:hypothetical protein